MSNKFNSIINSSVIRTRPLGSSEATHSINQSPTVLLHHASELIQDVLEDRLLDNESLQEAWVERGFVWVKDYRAYLSREHGDDV